MNVLLQHIATCVQYMTCTKLIKIQRHYLEVWFLCCDTRSHMQRFCDTWCVIALIVIRKRSLIRGCQTLTTHRDLPAVKFSISTLNAKIGWFCSIFSQLFCFFKLIFSALGEMTLNYSRASSILSPSLWHCRARCGSPGASRSYVSLYKRSIATSESKGRSRHARDRTPPRQCTRFLSKHYKSQPE